jgi:Peptidase inhibitor family I36
VPVQAQSDRSSCPRGSGCVWNQTSFQGKMAEVPSTGCIDSKIKSAANDSDGTIAFFMGAGCYGPRAGTLRPGQEAPEINAGSATGDCSQGGAVDPCDDQTVPGSNSGI